MTDGRSRKTKKTGKQISKVHKRTARSRKSGDFKQMLLKDPFKPWFVCQLTYSDQIELTSNSLGLYGTEKIFRLNNLYDVDSSGVGHQPYYFDQLTAIYNRYKVNGVKIDLTFTDPNGDGIEVCAMVQHSGDPGAITNQQVGNMTERPMCAVKHLNNSGSQVQKIQQYFNIWDIEGCSKLQYDAATSDIYCGNYNDVNTPSAVPLLRIACASNNLSSGMVVKCIVKLTYYTRFYERRIVGQS